MLRVCLYGIQIPAGTRKSQIRQNKRLVRIQLDNQAYEVKLPRMSITTLSAFCSLLVEEEHLNCWKPIPCCYMIVISTPSFAAGYMAHAGLPVLEEEVNDLVAAVVVIEEDVQRPVHEPASLLQLLQNGGEGVGVNDLLQFHEVLCGHIPPLHENL